MEAKLKRRLKINISGYLFTSSVILGVLIFCYIPAVQSLIYSFFEYDGFSTMNYIGRANFKRLFTTDIETLIVFRNTFLYAFISIPLNIVLGFCLALFANGKLKGISFFRLLFYLPVIIPGVVAGILWKDIFDSRMGIFNRILSPFGIQSTFFEQADTAMATLIFTNYWAIGGGMVIWLAALKNIPETLYESAGLDGANFLQKTFRITVPMATTVIFYNLVTGIIGSLQTFSTFIIASGSAGRGPDNSLYFISVKIYDEAFTRFGNMGYASALGWVLFAVIGVLTALVFKTNGWVQYMED
jgi:multiple sugar transport system permease protein